MVREEDRLGVLKVSAAGHSDTKVLFCTVKQDLDQLDNLLGDDAALL